MVASVASARAFLKGLIGDESPGVTEGGRGLDRDQVIGPRTRADLASRPPTQTGPRTAAAEAIGISRAHCLRRGGKRDHHRGRWPRSEPVEAFDRPGSKEAGGEGQAAIAWRSAWNPDERARHSSQVEAWGEAPSSQGPGDRAPRII